MLIARRDQVEAELAKLAICVPCAHTVARLRCLRGIDTLTALGLCAEIGEWERFDHPDQLASYLGIVPSEHTTGSQRRLGSITKAGSTHARRLLVEASWHYRRGPAVGEALERRQRGHAPEIINISWKAQRRLNARWRQLKDTRRKPGGIVAVAIARELAAYCWEIATIPTALVTDAHTNDSQEAHQLTLTPHPRCGSRGGPSIPARAQQLRDLSPEQRLTGRRARL